MEKPEELFWYELIEETGLSLYPGGIINQPYAAFCSIKIVKNAVENYKKILKSLNDSFNQQNSNQ